MSLNETLDAIRAMMSEEATAALAEVLRRFDSQSLGKHALKAGDEMPEFILPNAEGKLVSSATLLRNGALIIAFYRGSWCPYCSATLQALDAFVAPRGQVVTLVALAPETGGHARTFKATNNLKCEVLVDVDNAVAAQFGVVVRLPNRYRKLLFDRGLNPEALHGAGGWFIPLASTFVVSPEGRIVHAEIHVDHTRRTELDELPPVLAKFRSRK